MTFRRKATITALAASMLATSFAGFPLSEKGLAEKLGLVSVANAASAELPSSAFLDRLNQLHAALAAGDPVDVQEVRNLRDEIASLDETKNAKLLDPIWNKISPKLPESVDQDALKASLFRIIKAVGSIQYDPGASNLEAIRTNPEYRATLKTIAALGGDANITIDDFLVFLFGDGGSRKGVEGTIRDQLAGMSSMQLMLLLGNKGGIVTVLLQSMEQLLGKTEDYKFSSILSKLDITPQDVRATVLNFQNKLQKDEPAISAMTVAYFRSAAQESVKISEDGLQHKYTLKVFGVEVPAAVLTWSKLSGSSDITVAANGTVTIPAGKGKASAVIQAKLMNPYGGSAKVVFEKEITLGSEEEEGEGSFPSEQFLARMNKLYAALAAGDPADLQDVRNFRDEIAGLNSEVGQALLAPVWSKIALKLPATADQAKLKKSLFDMIQAIGSVTYDPTASGLEAIRTNPEYRATLKEIAAAGGGQNLVMDDFLVFLFGDGKSLKGVEGTVREKLASLSSTELLRLLGNNKGITEILFGAMQQLLGETEGYKLSSILNGLGVTPQDVLLTAANFQQKLQKDEPAINALTVAYMRSESTEEVVVSKDGREHDYKLKILGIEVPALALKWSKVSGSKDITVLANGKVTLAKKVPSASAVIEARLLNPYGGEAKVIFKKEVKLEAVKSEGAVFPEEPFFVKMTKLYAALEAGGASKVKDVLNLKKEIAELDLVKDQGLIDPIWNKVSPNLPDSIDKAQLKTGLFAIVKAVGYFQYMPTAADLEELRNNADAQAILSLLAEAGGVDALSIDDFLILMFGDGAELKGISGTVSDKIAGMKSTELAKLLRNKDNMEELNQEAMTAVLSKTDDYALSEALHNLGVKSADVQSTVKKIKSKLKKDEAAITALNVAYVRSEAVPTVKVSEKGSQHDYGLTLLGVEIPSSSLKWERVSGSKDISVTPQGKVTLAKKADKGTAVIQATLSKAFGDSGQVIYKQEVTLSKDTGGIDDPTVALNLILKDLDVKIAEIAKKLDAAKNNKQKVDLIMDSVILGNEAVTAINKVNTTTIIKLKAITEAKLKVNKMILLIIKDLMSF